MIMVLLDGPLATLLALLSTPLALGFEPLYVPQRPRRRDDARRVLQTLHPDPRRVQGRPDRHGPLVREQPGVVTTQIRLQPAHQRRRAGGAPGPPRQPPPLQTKALDPK